MLDLRVPPQVNFETAEKDLAKIMEKIIGNQDLLKLLYYNSPDCLEKEDIINEDILLEITKENIRIVPNLMAPVNKGSYLIITFDNFSPNDTNPQFIDNLILFDVLCPIDSWGMNDYMVRPLRIQQKLQELFDKKKLNGIGKVNFASSSALHLGDYAGYQLTYLVINNV